MPNSRPVELRAGVPDFFPVPSQASVEHVATELKPLQKVRLLLTNAVLTVVGASDFGSLELLTLPDKNLLVMACEANLTLTKGNTATGIVATTDLDVGIGTAAASATTLATTMINILPKVDADVDSLSDVVKSHSLAAVPVLLGVLDGAANKIYLNVAIPGLITVTDTVTFNGTIDLFLFDLGDVSS
jgi:hypothetical protein